MKKTLFVILAFMVLFACSKDDKIEDHKIRTELFGAWKLIGNPFYFQDTLRVDYIEGQYRFYSWTFSNQSDPTVKKFKHIKGDDFIEAQTNIKWEFVIKRDSISEIYNGLEYLRINNETSSILNKYIRVE